MKKIMLFSLIAILLVVTGCNPNPKTEGGGGTDSGVAENFPVTSDGAMPDDIFNAISAITNIDPSNIQSNPATFEYGPTDMAVSISYADKTGKPVLTVTDKILSNENSFEASSTFMLSDGKTASIRKLYADSEDSSAAPKYFIDNAEVDYNDFELFKINNGIDEILLLNSIHSRSATGTITGTFDDYTTTEEPLYKIGFEAEFSGNKTYEKMTFGPAYNNKYAVVEIWNETEIINGKGVMTSATVRLTKADGTVSTYALTENQLNSFNADDQQQ